MLIKFKSFFKEDILSSISSNLVKIIRGPLLAVIIILYLTTDEQGYWYTFQSLIVFAIVGDFGISRLIIVVFPEYHVKIKTAKNFGESKKYLSDYSAILFIYLFIYIVIIVVAAFLLILFIEYFYTDWSNSYLNSWFYCAIAASINLLSSFTSAALYGSDLVSKKNYFEQIFGIIFTVSASILLFLNFKIDSLAISIFIGFFISHLYLLFSYYIYLKKLYKLFNFKKGFRFLLLTKKLQLNFFTSTILSLYISSSLVPFVMKIFDPNLAGKVGLSIFLINSIVTFSLILNYIEYPKIIKLINLKKYLNVRNKCIKLLFLINCFFLLLSFIILTLIFLSPEPIGQYFDRLLPFTDLLLIFITQGILMNIGFIAGVVRGFKVEPYWILGIIQIFTTSLLFYFTMKTNSIRTYLTFDLVLHLLILLPITVYLGRNQLKKLF